MIGISLGEMMVILIVFIIVIPSEDIPKVLSKIWHTFSEVKSEVDSLAKKVTNDEFFNEFDQEVNYKNPSNVYKKTKKSNIKRAKKANFKTITKK